MTTITVDTLDIVELTEILEYLIGSLDTLVAPATIAPSANGDAYDLNDVRTAITRLTGRLLPSPPTPAGTDTDFPELITISRGDIEDIAHILGRLEDFLLHETDPTELTRFLAADGTSPQSLTRWVAELASYLRRRLEHTR